MEIWDTYWSHKKYEPILLNPPNILYGGTNTEPLASIGMSCFIDPIKEKFLNGFTILDYGCGTGILANFISERIFDFKSITFLSASINFSTSVLSKVRSEASSPHSSNSSLLALPV